MTFASDTTVSVERSRAEIERLLQRYGASQFVSGWSGDTAALGFVVGKLSVRFELPLPDRAEFGRTPSGRVRHNARKAEAAREQACRSRWRALLLVIKAKLEAVEVGISTVEQEFLAWTVVPGTGTTVYQQIGPKLLKAAETGEAPRLLLTGGA